MKLTVTAATEAGGVFVAGRAGPDGVMEKIFGAYGRRIEAAGGIAVEGLTLAIKTRARLRITAGGFKSKRLPFVVRSDYYGNRDDPRRGPTGIVASNWRTKLGGRDKLAPFVFGLTLRPRDAKRMIVPARPGPGFAAMVKERLLQLGRDPTLGTKFLPGGRILVYDRRPGRKDMALAILTPIVNMPKKIEFGGVAANAAEELSRRFDQAMTSAPEKT